MKGHVIFNQEPPHDVSHCQRRCHLAVVFVNFSFRYSVVYSLHHTGRGRLGVCGMASWHIAVYTFFSGVCGMRSVGRPMWKQC